MIRFGTGGWRAIMAEEFTFENVRRVAKAISIYIRELGHEEKPVVIGHDLRFMSGRFSRAFAEVLADENIPVWFIEDAVPTPMLMYAVEQEKLDVGIMITASHNPPEYNGIKVIVEKGKDAPVEVTDRLEKILDSVPFGVIPTAKFFDQVQRGTIQYYSNKNAYIDSILSQVDVKAIQSKNLKVLFNPMHGVAKDIMAMCLASLRCSIDVINGKRDTMFGAKAPSPSRESLQDMEYRMKEGRYHMGLATDGDSDRLGLYDELGNYIDANQVLKLLYYYLKAYRNEKGGVVRNLTTTHIVDRIAEQYGEPAFEVPVGFKYISAKMDEENLLLGGESSGGLKIRGHVNGKDGILAAMLAVEMVAKTGKTLSQLNREIDERFGTYYFHSVNLSFAADHREALTRILMAEKYLPVFPKEMERVTYVDGVKVYFTDGTWVSIRFSGTEPVLRIFMEMNDETEAQRYAAIVLTDDKLRLDSRS